MFTFLCVAMHYTPNLFDLTTRVDGSMHSHFQVQALLISENSILEQKTLIPGGDQHTFCNIIFTNIFRNDDMIIFSRPILYSELSHQASTDSCLFRMAHSVVELCY